MIPQFQAMLTAEYERNLTQGMTPDAALASARLYCTKNTGQAIKLYVQSIEDAYQALRRELSTRDRS